MKESELTKDEIIKRIEILNDKLFFLEMADLLTREEKQRYTQLTEELSRLRKLLKQYEGQ